MGYIINPSNGLNRADAIVAIGNPADAANSRSLKSGSGIIITDNGAGGTVVISASGGSGTVIGGTSENGTAIFDSVNSTSTQLAFNGVSAGSSKVAIAGGGSNSAVTVDVVPGNIAYSSLGSLPSISNQSQSGSKIYDDTNSTSTSILFNEVKGGSSKVSISGGGNNTAISIDVNQGNLSLSSIGGSLGIAQINATGSAGSTTYLRGDGSWSTVSGGSGTVTGGASENGTYAIYDATNSTSTTLEFNGLSSAGGALLSGGGNNTAITVSTQSLANIQNNNSYTIVAGDLGKTLITNTAASGSSYTLPNPSTVGSGWYCYIVNDIPLSNWTTWSTSNSIAVAPHGLEKINGTASILFYITPQQGVFVQCDGTNWNIAGVANGTGLGGTPASINFGSTPVDNSQFTITDSRVTTSSLIYVQRGYNNDTDELDMDPMIFSAIPGSGNFTVSVNCLDGPVIGTYYINYLVS